ncbi:MAG: hypothetical protein QMD01_07090 [Thermodesulfovibrionales bacterium]|nr:hypothetical protein [Thermodesulfovibrionales bacterium]
MGKKSITIKVLIPIVLTILVLSALAFLKLRQTVTAVMDDFHAEAGGAKGFVQKPFTAKTIALAIKKALST